MVNNESEGLDVRSQLLVPLGMGMHWPPCVQLICFVGGLQIALYLSISRGTLCSPAFNHRALPRRHTALCLISLQPR